MNRRWVAFDIETAAILSKEEMSNWRRHRPLGVICAATCASFDDPVLHYSTDNFSFPREKMTRSDAQELVHYLLHMRARGYTIVTWNGLAFDFDVLAEESGLFDECVELALQHVDMMFHVVCLRGHYLGLDKAAKGLGLSGKTAGRSGADAPLLWLEGRFDEVLEYVAQDAYTTLQVAQEVERRGALQWTSASGRTNVVEIERWLTVEEALQLPESDVSWMSAPVDRMKLLEWTCIQERRR